MRKRAERGRDDPTPIMVSGATAARIAGISPQRLWYWENGSPPLIQPTYRREVGPRTIIRMYSLDRLTELVVAARLVGQPGISLQHIRRLIRRLRKRGYAAPLRELTFKVAGGEVFFKDEYGVLEGSRSPDQVVAEYSVDLKDIDSKVSAASRRSQRDVGRVGKKRDVHASQPVFQGTRVPVAAVFEYFNAGASDTTILREYPGLRKADLETAHRLHAIARRLKDGTTIEQVRETFPDLSDDDLRSVKQLVAAA